MNLKLKTATQLNKQMRRGMRAGWRSQVEPCAFELADRIERGPIRSCIPRKKQREAGLLPAVKP